MTKKQAVLYIIIALTAGCTVLYVSDSDNVLVEVKDDIKIDKDTVNNIFGIWQKLHKSRMATQG